MKAATLKEIRQELNNCSTKDLRDLCLRLTKFKKENKELLSYILFESYDELEFIRTIKFEMDQDFDQINRKSYYYIKKSVRKILKNTKKYIRYSQKKETEVELLIYFCSSLRNLSPDIKYNVSLKNIYNRQVEAILKVYSGLHEDLQYDYKEELEKLSVI